MTIDDVRNIINRISAAIMGVDVEFIVEYDKTYTVGWYTFGKYRYGRVYLQPVYKAPCTKTNVYKEWKGAKWYLSSHMTENEVIGTAFKAFKAAVEHEILEGFKVDGTILFNPHVDFNALLQFNRTAKEVVRDPQSNL